MPRKSNSTRLAEIHREALESFDSIQAALRDERLQCLQDRRFYSISGAQWEGALGDQFENRPRFEVNKIHRNVIRIFDDYRANQITVDFISKDGAADPLLADACDSLYRADEQDSQAEEAYSNAFEEAVGGGFGAFRLRAEYEDEESEDDERQRIKIEPIFDADSSVFFDLGAKRQDKSDARECFVITALTREEYERLYDDDPATWPKGITQTEFDWFTPDVVYVAEYFRVEEKQARILVFQGLDGTEVKHDAADLEADPEQAQMLQATGFQQVREKTIKKRKIHKYLMNGACILEDCGLLAGKEIPIIPVYGKRWYIDNVERCMGHVRLAKDSQRLKNMQLSKLAEISAMSAIEKPIFSPEQVAGHQVMWAEDNIKNYPYQLVNLITDPSGQQAVTGPLGYTKVPSIPPAMSALIQLAEADIQDILGNPQQIEKQVSHVAGKTVEMLADRVDAQSYIFISNLAVAMRRCGQVWLSMARDVYTEEGRKMKALGPNKEVRQLELQKPALGPNQEVTRLNDLTRASFDVVADVGPSSSSKRRAAFRGAIEMMGMAQDPETQAVLSQLALMNMDGEGLTDIRAWARKKLVRAGVVKPTPDEAQELMAELQNKPTNPNELYLKAEADKATAEAMKARADVLLTQAKTEETKAKTLQTMSTLEPDLAERKVRTLQTLHSIDTDRHSRTVETAQKAHDMEMDRHDRHVDRVQRSHDMAMDRAQLELDSRPKPPAGKAEE